MSSILSSQAMAFATAMAVSGTVLLLAICRQKSTIHPNSEQILRSCISSDGRKRHKKTKKRVQFAEDVVDPVRDGVEFRRECSSSSSRRFNQVDCLNENRYRKVEQIPANRLALYDGIFRDRVQRTTSSY